MEPIWGRQDPGGPHVGPMNFAICEGAGHTYDVPCLFLFSFRCCMLIDFARWFNCTSFTVTMASVTLCNSCELNWTRTVFWLLYSLILLQFSSSALIWMSLDFTVGQSTLVQVMAWCRQVTSHYLSQWCHKTLSPYCVTRPRMSEFIPLWWPPPCSQDPLTWFNFNPSMDTENVVWNHLPFPNCKDATVEVWEWISNFILHYIMDIITYPCWD